MPVDSEATPGQAGSSRRNVKTVAFDLSEEPIEGGDFSGWGSVFWIYDLLDRQEQTSSRLTFAESLASSLQRYRRTSSSSRSFSHAASVSSLSASSIHSDVVLLNTSRVGGVREERGDGEETYGYPMRDEGVLDEDGELDEGSSVWKTATSMNASVPPHQQSVPDHRREDEASSPALESQVPHQKHQMGEWMSTAIAANDLVGSILYTIGVTTLVAGKYAPLSLLLVCLTLFPFKRIIEEVGTRVPLNGGVYSTMALSSSKTVAAIAGCASLLDYVSTAVVSAASASSYFQVEFGIISVYWSTLCLLAFFGILTMTGVKESSVVSLGILMIHSITIISLATTSIVTVSRTGVSVLRENMNAPSVSSSYTYDIFVGYCVGMLGVTGFETSANYIEMQAPGVFPKTLRNMCYMVLACNPVMSFLSLAALPMTTITSNSNTVLSVLAQATGGKWLRIWLAVDAVIVLCGGVLTAFVGVGGLIEHMAVENLLPSFLLITRSTTTKNKQEDGIPPLIPLTFLVLCSLLFITFQGDVTALTLVFSMSFLCVLGMFVVSNGILRVRMETEAEGFHVAGSEKEGGGWTLLGGGCLVILAMVGNAIYSPNMVITFGIFYIGLLVIIMLVLNRIRIARLFFLILGVSLVSPSSSLSQTESNESQLSPLFSSNQVVQDGRTQLQRATSPVSNHSHVSDQHESTENDMRRRPGNLDNNESNDTAGSINDNERDISDIQKERMRGKQFRQRWRGRDRASLDHQNHSPSRNRSQDTQSGNGFQLQRNKWEKDILQMLHVVWDWVCEIREKPVAYFTNGEQLHHLNHVIQYVQTNEPTSRLIIVHCFEEESKIPASLEANCRFLDHVYPPLTLDLVLVKCKFSSRVIPLIAKRLGVQRNMCLVSRPWTKTANLGEIKGARVIMLRR